jgi:hypothetical protein
MKFLFRNFEIFWPKFFMKFSKFPAIKKIFKLLLSEQESMKAYLKCN